MQEQAKKMSVKEMQVFSTNDYNIFGYIEGNRKINELHVERLKESMKEDYLISPITVNEKFQIIDGQHRFEAIRDLNLQVYYIICQGYGLEEVHRLNQINATWTKKDFLQGYIDKGNKNYIQVKEFMEEFNINSVSISIELLNKDVSQRIRERKFRDGIWEPTSTEWAYEFMNHVEDFKDVFDSCKTTLFLKAFKKLYQYKEYEHENMLKKLDYMDEEFGTRATIEQYLDMLTEIYNYKTMKKKKIFVAEGDLISY